MAENQINTSNKYFGVEAEIDTSRLDKALQLAPQFLQEELMDAFDHVRKAFFIALFQNTGLKDKRFIKTKDRGIGKRIRVYRNPRLGDPLDMELGIFSRSKIVSAHEKGATITSSTGGMLAIPIGEALNARGRLKGQFNKYASYREVPGLFPIFLNGKMFLVKRDKEGKLKLYFVLKNQVRIQPRLRFYDTWANMEGYRMNILNKAISKALKRWR
jgi:hypothetical protein